MIYEVTAKILYSSEDEANDFYRDCTLALAKGGGINTDHANIEISHISLLISNHDLSPPEPSEVVDEEYNSRPLPQ